VIAVLNEAFIPVYVDADRRQDLTRQYLERGWPTTVIMAPNGTRLLGYSGSRPAQFILPMLRQAVDYVQGSTYELTIADYDYTESAFVRPTEAKLKKLLENYSGFILKGYDRTLHVGINFVVRQSELAQGAQIKQHTINNFQTIDQGSLRADSVGKP
jgi:hypothetical protein